MFKVQYLSILTPELWVDASWLGAFSSERRAQNAGCQIQGYEIRIVRV
ncbi:hypothetical protein LMG28138_01834 [Pararobbsia alpina]|uniref:Uncharacterized protein n=1 Tax=Pararobbsia alpina TaxID=621374 RepID=A0A6S7B226_9BURK|nr:hypothetical protein LMG28138_01834 [Pararobbsia alpina]